MGSAIFSAWQRSKKHGTYPAAGGWLDQPLDMLAQINAIELVYNTVEYMQAEKSNWGKLTKTQKDVIGWVSDSK